MGNFNHFVQILGNSEVKPLNKVEIES